MIPKHVSKPQPRRKRWLALTYLSLLALAAPACQYDGEQRCGSGLEYDSQNGRCVCPANAAYSATGCVACNEHEIASPAGCVCEQGYARSTPDAVCAAVPQGLGASCDPAASLCAAPFDRCEPSATAGYCTSACTSNEQCSGGYACNAQSICQRPPVGLGQSCDSPDDCAGTEATFCDTFQTHACQVQGCQVDPNNCFAGFECCDLSAFGVPQPLCVPQGLCMP
jgi:hypothetical protein